MITLILGCGRRRDDPEAIGLDIVDFGWNKVCDVSRETFPAGDSSVDAVLMENILEHIARPAWPHLFNECWRVLKPGGVLTVIAPDAEKDMGMAMADPTHVSLVVKGTFAKYLTGEKPRNADYGFKRWAVQEIRQFAEKDPRAMYVRLTPQK